MSDDDGFYTTFPGTSGQVFVHNRPAGEVPVEELRAGALENWQRAVATQPDFMVQTQRELGQFVAEVLEAAFSDLEPVLVERFTLTLLAQLGGLVGSGAPLPLALNAFGLGAIAHGGHLDLGGVRS